MKFDLIIYFLVLLPIAFAQYLLLDDDLDSYTLKTSNRTFKHYGETNNVNYALNKFSLKILAEISSHGDTNLALSPYTIWTVLSVINEGARGNTAEELRKLLGIPSNFRDRETFRKLQENIIKNITQRYDGVTLDVFNAIFTRLERRLNTDYQKAVQKIYDTEVSSLDFKNVSGVTELINTKLSDATEGRIQDIIDEETVREAELIIASALFFKGLWNRKYDKKYTKEEPFYNEDGKEIGKVNMMVGHGFRTVSILNDQADAIELPYIEERMSMIVILPTRNVKLSSVLQVLTDSPITEITDQLKEIGDRYQHNFVRIPKFKISSKLSLENTLQSLGVQDVFSSSRADLTGISHYNIYISKVKHAAEIEVDEEGTVASGVTFAEAIPVSIPTTYNINKPFLFFIFDKKTQSIVFLGKFSSPSV